MPAAAPTNTTTPKPNDYLGNGGSCVVLQVAGGAADGVRLLGGNGVVTDVSATTGGRKTNSGVELGDPEAKVLKVYGARNVKVEPLLSEGKQVRWLVLRPQGSPTELAMRIDGGKVQEIALGLVAATPGVRGACT